ncbi:hypothetical protein RFI_35711, partial [Reticulomyxa filosa]
RHAKGNHSIKKILQMSQQKNKKEVDGDQTDENTTWKRFALLAGTAALVYGLYVYSKKYKKAFGETPIIESASTAGKAPQTITPENEEQWDWERSLNENDRGIEMHYKEGVCMRKSNQSKNQQKKQT